MSVPFGILNVTVLKAEHLKTSDLFSKSDPYVVVNTNAETQETFIADVNDKDEAIWNERLTFKVTETIDDLRVLNVSIWDKDAYGENDQIASYLVRLGNAVTKDTQEFLQMWTESQDEGVLWINIHYIPMSAFEKMMEKLGKSVEAFKDKLVNQIVTIVKERVISI